MKTYVMIPTYNERENIKNLIDKILDLKIKNLYIVVTVIALEANIKPRNYKVISLGMPKNPTLQRIYRLFFFLDSKKMDYYKKLKDYDVIISHFYPMNWLAYEAKKHYNIKYIYFNHGVNTTGLLNNIWQKLYMEIFSFLTNITLKNVDQAYSVSKYLKGDLKKVSGLDSKVVYNKIDKKRFNKKVKGSKIIKKYNLKNKKVLLYVGRIAPHKGIHLLLQSFKIIKKSIPNAKLIIAGKPTFSNYFNKLRKKNSLYILCNVGFFGMPNEITL